MRKIALFAVTLLLCAMTSVCSAFELDRGQWINFADVNNIETFYNARSIQNNGSTAKVWLCYHYKAYDTYRLMLKEYTRGSKRARILKMLDYYSDGTFKQGSNKIVPDVGFGANEEAVVKKLW